MSHYIKKLSQAANKIVDVFVGNVPHGTRAPDLVNYLHAKILLFSSSTTTSTEAHILRCEVMRKGSTFAFVTLRSREIAEALQDCAGLEFGGRMLRVKPSKATFQRRMGIAPGFKCGGFQLCAEWPPGELTCLWAVTSEVKFQVKKVRFEWRTLTSRCMVSLRQRPNATRVRSMVEARRGCLKEALPLCVLHVG